MWGLRNFLAPGMANILSADIPQWLTNMGTGMSHMRENLVATGAKIRQFSGTMQKSLGQGLAKSLSIAGSAVELLQFAMQRFLQMAWPVREFFDLFETFFNAALAPVMGELAASFFNESMINLMMGIAEMLATAISPAFALLADVMQAFVDSGLIDVFIEIIDMVVSTFTLAMTLLQPLIDAFVAMFETFLTMWVAFYDDMRPIIDLIAEWVILVLTVSLTEFVDSMMSLMPNIQDALLTMFDAFAQFMVAIEPHIPTFIQIFVQIMNILTDVATVLGGVAIGLFQAFAASIGAIFLQLADFLNDNSELITALLGTLMDAFSWFAGQLSTDTADFLNDLLSFAVSAADALRFFSNVFTNFINFFIDAANMIDFLDVFPDIPRLNVPNTAVAQMGGLVMDEGFAYLHRGEQVVTAETVQMLNNTIMQAQGGSGGSRQTSITVNVPFATDENRRALVRDLRRETFLRGDA